jgi:predicted nucleic acid-binding Zn ribbon protein
MYFHFMKPRNELPLKEAILQLLESFHLKERVNELRLKENWEKIFGKTIAKYTQHISVRDKKLFLNIESASLRQELTFNKVKMIERINESIAPGFVEEIVLR